ncbi:MAG TPA: hypothetical protein VGO52_10330 [Hyphomonadaceae bacterium]|nr:hypothetical protein [Hyphomonadaceae bacterium]
MTGAPSWPASYFDAFAPDGQGEPPELALRFLIDHFRTAVQLQPVWTLEGPDTPVHLSLISHEPTTLDVGFRAGAHEGVITFTADPSNWLRIEAAIAGRQIFLAFLDHPYEEHELWPANTMKASEGPGRMGKRRNWLSLDTDAWPALKPLTESQFLNLTAVE